MKNTIIVLIVSIILGVLGILDVNFVFSSGRTILSGGILFFLVAFVCAFMIMMEFLDRKQLSNEEVERSGNPHITPSKTETLDDLIAQYSELFPQHRRPGYIHDLDRFVDRFMVYFKDGDSGVKLKIARLLAEKQHLSFYGSKEVYIFVMYMRSYYMSVPDPDANEKLLRWRRLVPNGIPFDAEETGKYYDENKKNYGIDESAVVIGGEMSHRTGTKKQVRVECSSCDGSGVIVTDSTFDRDGGIDDCYSCNGNGYHMVDKEVGGRCDKCNGSGEIVSVTDEVKYNSDQSKRWIEKVKKTYWCEACGGSGREIIGSYTTRPCYCASGTPGKVAVWVKRTGLLGGEHEVKEIVTCDICHGTGKIEEVNR